MSSWMTINRLRLSKFRVPSTSLNYLLQTLICMLQMNPFCSAPRLVILLTVSRRAVKGCHRALDLLWTSYYGFLVIHWDQTSDYLVLLVVNAEEPLYLIMGLKPPLKLQCQLYH